MEEERERKRDENVIMNGIIGERERERERERVLEMEFGGYRWKIRSG